MRVLLAGSTGVVGCRLVPLLEAAGHEVVGLARSASADVPVDLLDRDAVLAALAGESFDAVVHHATGLRRRIRGHRSMEQTNRLRMEGTNTLLAVARATGARRMVSASAFYGYGFYDHGTEPLPETATFGVSVGSANDDVLRALESLEQQTAAARGVNLRLGLLYGDHPLPVVASDFSAELPLLHVEDAAAATLWALEKGRPGQSYNIADDTPTPLAEAHRAEQAARHSPGLRALPSWMLRGAAPFGAELLTRTSMRVSTAKARRAGWRPAYPSHAEGVAR